jgi:hypothetical protein
MHFTFTSEPDRLASELEAIRFQDRSQLCDIRFTRLV